MSTPIEPPEDPSGPRRPWGARVNRVAIGLLGLMSLWMLVEALGDGLAAVPVAVMTFAIAVIGLLAIEIVVLAPWRRYPSIVTGRPAVATAIVVFAIASTVVRELGIFGIDLRSSQFRTTYVSRGKVAGTIPASPLGFDCTIRCHGEEVCDAMGDAITAACSSSSPNHIVIDLWVDDPFCYTPLVKSFETSFVAQAAVPSGSLHFDANTSARVVGVSSCRSARREAGTVLARQLLVAISEALERPDRLMWRCADGSMTSRPCTDPWTPP